MAYGYKYTSGFYDRIGDFWEFKINQKGYTGAVVPVDHMKETPVSIEYGVSTRWMFQPVYASNLNWGFAATSRFQFDDLTDVDSTKNRIELYLNGSIYWMGYCITDLYSEPIKLKEDPIIDFVAADLVILENYDFTLKGDENGYATHFEIVKYCLNKLDFDFGFRIATSIETDFFGDQLLSLANKVSIFEDLNCYEVLQKTLVPYGTCYQCNGRWHIISNRKKTSTFSYKDYDSTGALETTANYAGLVNTSRFTQTNFFGLISGEIQKLPPVKEFTINQELGVRDEIVVNGSFDEGYTEFQSWFHWMWVANTLVEVMQKDDTNFIVVKRAGYYYSNPGSIAKDIRQELLDGFPFSSTTNQLLKVSLKYALLGDEGASAWIYISLKNSSDQYLMYNFVTETYSWGNAGDSHFILIGTDPASPVQHSAQILEDLSFSTFSMNIPLTTGAITLMLNNEVSPTGNTIGACFTDVSAHIINADETELDSTFETTTEINANNNYVPEDIELLFGNKPDPDMFNELIAYDNIILPQWTLNYEGFSGTLQECLAQQIINAYSDIPLMLKVRFYSDIFTIDSVWTDPSLPSTRFMPLMVTFEPRMRFWDGDLIQINTVEEITPDFLDDDFADDDFYDKPSDFI